MKGRPVPEEYRRALRLCIGVGLPCLLGYGVILPDSRWAYNKAFAQSCKWAAITVVVVTMPVIGKVGQVGAERTLGTIIGGLLGFLVHAVGSTYWNDESDGVVLSVAAGMVAFSSVIVGSRLKLDLSARLFVITFLLVCFGSQDGRDPLKLAISRIGGIVMGVLISLILSVVVLPKSATMECVHNLEKALQSLSKLNELAWRSHLPDQPKETGQRPVVAGPSLDQQPSTTRTQSDGYEALPNGSSDAPGNPAAGKGAYSKAEFEEYEEQCEKVLTDIYQALFKQQENADLAKAEILLGSCGNHLVFVPGLPLIGRQSKHMPWDAMTELATSVRRVARLLLTVIATMEGGSFEAQMQTVLGDHYPEGLLQELALAMQAAVKSMCRSFPHADTCPHDCLLALSAAVKKLVGVSDVQRRAIIRALRGGRERRFAQASWQRLIDTVRQQQAAAAAAATAEQPPSPQSLSAPTSPAARQWQRGGEGDPFARAESGVAAPATPAADAEGSGRNAGLPPGPTKSPSGNVRGPPPKQLAGREGQPSAAPGRLTGLFKGPGGQPGRGLLSFQSAADQLLAMASQARRDLVGHGLGASASASRTASEAEGLQNIATEGSRGTGAAAAAERATQRVISFQRGQQAQQGQPASGSSSHTSSPDAPLLSQSYPPGPGGSGDWQAALRPISSEELAQLMGEELEGGEGRHVDGSQGQKVHLRTGPQRSETLRLAMFPETAEGYVAQVRWYSFQFLLEDVLDELVDLHQALCNTLARLP